MDYNETITSSAAEQSKENIPWNYHRFKILKYHSAVKLYINEIVVLFKLEKNEFKKRKREIHRHVS